MEDYDNKLDSIYEESKKITNNKSIMKKTQKEKDLKKKIERNEIIENKNKKKVEIMNANKNPKPNKTPPKKLMKVTTTIASKINKKPMFTNKK